jgi:hypothetical protein
MCAAAAAMHASRAAQDTRDALARAARRSLLLPRLGAPEEDLLVPPP